MEIYLYIGIGFSFMALFTAILVGLYPTILELKKKKEKKDSDKSI